MAVRGENFKREKLKMASNNKEAVLERYKKVKELIAGGLKHSAACKQVGMDTNTFKKIDSGRTPGKKRRKTHTKKHQFVDLVAAPVSAPGSSVAVIVCTPEQVAAVIRGLK